MDSSSPKIALEIMYDGAYFHGWQVQKNANSVQETLQDALEKVLSFRPDISGCSRTDAGVHANHYVCHFDADSVNLSPVDLPKALNFYLKGKGVSVKSARLEDKDFHSRYSCTAKEYIYKIWNNPYPNPFLEDKTLFYPRHIDIEKFSHLEREFEGKHDFRAFMSKGSKNEDNTVRCVKYFKVSRDSDGLITISTCADGFLYNMVRIMVGTYLECIQKNAPQGTISDVINSLDRKNAGDTAPAHALYLNKVFYS